MFNPLKYRYHAHFVGEEGHDVFLQVTQGSHSQILRFPKNLLPQDFDPQEGIQITLSPTKDHQKSDIDTLKSLLQELIG